MTSTELDPVFKYGLKLLHSTDKKSAQKLRQKIDELAPKNKQLSKTISQRFLAEEEKCPGSCLTVKKPRVEKKAAPPVATQIFSVSDSGEEDSVVEEDHLKELEDLMCVVCKLMDVSARNRLVECCECHSLFHQQCHKPQISETDANDQENSWYCSSCKGKVSPAKSSSSSSNYESSTSSSRRSVKTKTAKHSSPTNSDRAKH